MGGGLGAFRSGFDSDEKLVPMDVIARNGGPASRKRPLEYLEFCGLIGFHEQPVGKRSTAGAGDLIAEQLDRAIKDSVIVRLENALFLVIQEPYHARLFDGPADQWDRFEHRHP